MSNTVKTVVAKPYFNLDVESQLDSEDQKLKQNGEGSGDAGQTTQTPANAATSDSEDQSYKERWVNLKRYHDTAIHEARQKIKDLEERMNSNDGSITPPKTVEELKKFQEDHPELYRAMEALVAQKGGPKIDMDRFQALEDELARSKQESALSQIKSAHPDYVDVVASPKFQEWVDGQATAVQRMVKENADDASSFIRALDLYKLDAGITSANKGASIQKSRNDASAADAVLVRGASKADVGEIEGRIWTRDEISKLTPSEFEMFEQDIDSAWREGRVR